MGTDRTAVKNTFRYEDCHTKDTRKEKMERLNTIAVFMRSVKYSIIFDSEHCHVSKFLMVKFITQ